MYAFKIKNKQILFQPLNLKYMVHLQTKLEEKHYKNQRHIVLEQMALKMHVALKIQQS